MQKKRSAFPLYASIELLYWLGYSASAFLAAYLADQSFSGTVVGTIMAVVNLIGVLSAPLMGNAADKSGLPRRVFIVCAAAVALVAAAIPFGVRHAVFGVNLVIPLYFAWAFFCKPMSGLCDGWILNVIDNGGGFSYGAIRYIGSFGYALMCVLYAAAAKRAGTQDVIFYLYAGINVVLCAVCVYARRDDRPVRREKQQKVGLRAVFGQYYLLVYLVCHCLVNLPMYCSITFIPYKLIELTGQTGSLGNITALRSLAEIPMLILSVHVIRRFGVQKCLWCVMAAFAAVQVLFIAATGVGMLTVAMILMGFINGAFMACYIRYVHEIAPPAAANSALTLCVSTALVSAMAGNVVGGMLVDAFGTTAYFLFAMASAALAAVVFAVSFPVGKRLGKEYIRYNEL